MTTKRQIIKSAFSELGMGARSFDLSADDWDEGLTRLNALMAEWGISGVGSQFPVTGDPSAGELDVDAGISPALVRGVSAALAADLSPGYGKHVSPETKVAAEQGRKLAFRVNAVVPKRMINVMATPAGAGWNPINRTEILLQPETEGDQ